MFTGIIESVVGVVRQGDGRLAVQKPRIFRDVRLGSSICVSGVCLTVTAVDPPHPFPLPRGEGRKSTMAFDVVPETLRRTTLGSVRKGDHVNLERALPACGRFEGHIVQGHIEGVGTVINRELRDSKLTIQLPKHLLSYVVEKGSIAIDGVSLTVAKLKENQCTVALIPYTVKNTTLGSLKKGDRVNIETDILARYVRGETENSDRL